jgi:hypothetical protein
VRGSPLTFQPIKIIEIMSKIKTQYYHKPFEDCQQTFRDKGLEVACTLRAGNESTYQARNSESKEIIAGGFDSPNDVIRHYGK